jgi:cysteine desulfurase
VARHYLDHASTSPLRPAVADALIAYAQAGGLADPGRPYVEGRAASAVIEEARSAVAALLSVSERRLIFTSGGTEAANWANRSARARASAGAPVLVAGVEHSAVRLSAEATGPVRALLVNETGRLDLGDLARKLDDGPRPALVHCQMANHEVGTVQPVEEALALCRAAGVPLHVDACMALGRVPLDLGALDADLVSISAHKAGGPPGIGALVLGSRTRVTPALFGGDQERARRAGMENAPGIIGFGALASTLAEPGRAARERAQSDAQIAAIDAAALEISGVVAYGDSNHRLPGLSCFGIADVEAEAVLLGLDQSEVAVHSGSACSSEAFEPSPVLQAMGVDADHSMRCSVGWSTTDADVAAFVTALPLVLERLRALR